MTGGVKRNLESGSGKHVMLRMLLLMKPHYKKVLLVLFLLIVANLSEILKPYMISEAVDGFMMRGTLGEGLYSLTGIGGLYLLIVLISTLSTVFQVRTVTRVCQSVLDKLRRDTFNHIHRMPLSRLDEMGTGRLITRATNDVEALDAFYGGTITELLKDVVMLIGIVITMLRMDYKLALVGFAVVPVIAVITTTIRGVLRRNFVNMKALIGRINGFFAESVAGMRVIQAFAREKEKYRQFFELNEAYKKTTLLQVKMNSVLRPVMEVVNTVGIALLLLYGFHEIGLIAEGTEPARVGVLIAFTMYMKQFFEPINDLAEKYNEIQSALVSADRIFSLLQEKEDLEQIDAPGYDKAMLGRVEFRDVHFAYEGEDWVLNGVSFVAEPGEKIAFVGATGAGKTTVINLLGRFYEPQRGEILIDSVPLQDWNLSALRGQIAVVLQDVFLFAGTVADNVRVNADIDDASVREALRFSCAEEFVDALPGGIYAPVAERGSTFSMGERQLLSFARAIAHKPAIFVLDEATANIDSATERLIKQSIESVSEGRTAIFIAHRLSTVRACDQIYALEHGKIVEHGTHDELLAADGLYAALYSGQLT